MLCPIKAEPSRAQQNWAELSRAEAATALCSALLSCRTLTSLPVCLSSGCMWSGRSRVEVLPPNVECANVRRGSAQRITQQSIKINNFRKYTKKHTHTHTHTHLHLRMPLTCVSQSVESHRAQRKCIWQIQREKCSLRAALEARTRAFRLKAFRVELFFVIYLYINNILWTAALPQTAEKASNSNNNTNWGQRQFCALLVANEMENRTRS